MPSNVLNIPLVGKKFGHPAVFPVALPAFFIKLLSPEGGMVLDPFGGSGTTAIAALELNRNSVIVDNNLDYCIDAVNRIRRELCEEEEGVIKAVNFKSPSPIFN